MRSMYVLLGRYNIIHLFNLYEKSKKEPVLVAKRAWNRSITKADGHYALFNNLKSEQKEGIKYICLNFKVLCYFMQGCCPHVSVFKFRQN